MSMMRWLRPWSVAAIGVFGVMSLLTACSAPVVVTPTPLAVTTLLQEGRCGACHQIPGVPMAIGTVGPPLCLVGEAYRRGEITVADIMNDIAQPNQRVHEGYLDDIMPDDYPMRFSDTELRRMAEFISTLRCSETPATVTPAAGGIR